MSRTAPRWFTKWLKRRFPDRRAHWNSDRVAWEIQKQERSVWGTEWTTELTYHRDNIWSDLCEMILRGAWFQRGQRFAEFWSERVTGPEYAHRTAQQRAHDAKLRDWQREGKKAAWRDLGKTVTVGAVKNERNGN